MKLLLNKWIDQSQAAANQVQIFPIIYLISILINQLPNPNAVFDLR